MRVVHERRAVIDPTKGDRVPGDAVIPVRIGLKQSNLEDGYDAVMDVSDPASSNYGKLAQSRIAQRGNELTAKCA